MIRAPSYARQFEKDLKRVRKRGKDLAKIKPVIDALINAPPLPAQHHDPVLRGNFVGRRECHIEPDWLLIYKLSDDAIVFERTGTHADLFE